MGTVIEGTELVAIGIHIEKNGYEFYMAMADKIEEEKSKNLFLFLAEEEQEHIVTFEDIQDSLEVKAEAASYPSAYFAYIRALAAEHVFTQNKAGSQTADTVSSPLAAIDLAISFEKDSILFYYEMLNVVAGEGEKNIEVLIKQKQEHLKKLSSIKQSLLDG